MTHELMRQSDLKMIEEMLVVALHENVRNRLLIREYSALFGKAVDAFSCQLGITIPAAISHIDDFLRKRRNEWTVDCLKGETAEGNLLECRAFMRNHGLRMDPRFRDGLSWINDDTGQTGTIREGARTPYDTHTATIRPKQ